MVLWFLTIAALGIYQIVLHPEFFPLCIQPDFLKNSFLWVEFCGVSHGNLDHKLVDPRATGGLVPMWLAASTLRLGTGVWPTLANDWLSGRKYWKLSYGQNSTFSLSISLVTNKLILMFFCVSFIQEKVYHFFVLGEFRGFRAYRAIAGVVLCVTGAEALYADMGHFGAGGP